MKNVKMKLSPLEQQVINTLREVSVDKQQFILEFSLFIKLSDFTHQSNAKLEKRQAGLGKGSAWISEDIVDELESSL